MAPRKVRLIVDLVRGKAVGSVITQLTFLQRDAALPVLKLIKSAMANAEHNFKIDPATLWIKTITADGGTTLKRSRPRAHGSAAPILKRTTHIMLALSNDPMPAKKRASTRPAKKARPVANKKAPVAESASTT
jgi:large subunit ribosomal protein L22